MNNKSAKYIIKKFSVIGDRRFGFSCHFEAHQRLLSLQISQPYLFMHWKKSVTSFLLLMRQTKYGNNLNFIYYYIMY